MNGKKASGMDQMWGELIFVFYPFSGSELLDGYDYSIFNPTTSMFPSGVGIIRERTSRHRHNSSVGTWNGYRSTNCSQRKPHTRVNVGMRTILK